MFQNWFSVWFFKLEQNFLSGFLEYLNIYPLKQKYGIKKLTWNGVLSTGRANGDSRCISNALHRAQANMVTEAQDMPAHDFSQLLNCMHLMLWHLSQHGKELQKKKPVITSMCAYNLLLWTANIDTWDRRKSCSSCSWCDSGMTRPSLCTTRICSTPIFSCSWIDLNIQNTLSLTWEGLEIPVRPIFDWHWGPVLIRNKLVLW